MKSSCLCLIFMLIFSSCQIEENQEPELALCEVTTNHFGQFSLSFYSSDPLKSGSKNRVNYESVCWENTYPIQIGSGGGGNCGEGYEGIQNPFASMGVDLVELDASQNNSYKRYLTIELPYRCEDYSTQEKFYDLLSDGEFDFASVGYDYGKFVVRYIVGGKEYSSLNSKNSSFRVEVSDIVKVKPNFNSEPAGNNGLPAAVDATFQFSSLLRAEDGEYLLIENARVRGRFYRQSPWGYYWEDWGKGWDK